MFAEQLMKNHCPILDSYGRGLGSEINYIPRRLVLSLFAFCPVGVDDSSTYRLSSVA